MREKWSAFPKDAFNEAKEYAAFLTLPDQALQESATTRVHHEGDLVIPLQINGRPTSYFLDTGAGAMSESEAARLGMELVDNDSRIGTSTGNRVGFRTAVARELNVGGISLSDVSFAVFPDDGQPWVNLKPGRRGLLGIPAILALRRIVWSSDGILELGKSPHMQSPSPSNLYFDDDHLVVGVRFQGRTLPLTLDTGAMTTDLYGPFAEEFSSVLDMLGERVPTEIQGVSSRETFDSVKLRRLNFSVAGFSAQLSPANVMLKQIGPNWSYGNVGLDVLRQAKRFTIDLDSMMLEMVDSPSTGGASRKK